MNSLPNTLTPTLPLILETENLANWDWKAVLVVLLLIILIYLLFYFLKAQKPKPELGYMKKMYKEFDILKSIYETQRRILAEENYQKGLLELSKILKEYIQVTNTYPRPITAMTVEELKKILESRNTIHILETLRNIQFSNSPITREVFEEAVKRAEALAKEKYFNMVKKR